MCFSPSASFTSGILLTGLGVASLKKNSVPNKTLFASIPLAFGLQQISEGFVWLSLQQSAFAAAEKPAMYAFLLMARVVWPVLMPAAVLRMEEDATRKKALRWFVWPGALVALYYSACLLFLHVAPNIEGRHVQYVSDFPEVLAVPAFALYLGASIPPLFLSRVRGTTVLGLVLLVSSMVTAVFYIEYLTSVWCFFAAISSVIIYAILQKHTAEAQRAQRV